MKRIVLAAIAVCLCLAGCAGQVVQTPVQVAANFSTVVHKSCAAVQPFADSAPAIWATLSPADQAALPLEKITKATEMIGKACSSGVPEPLSVTDLAKTAFPLMIKLVDASHLDQDKKSTATFALLIAQGALSSALAQ